MGNIIERKFSGEKMQVKDRISTEELQKRYTHIWDNINIDKNNSFSQKEAILLARTIVLALRKAMEIETVKDVPAQTPILGLVKSLGFDVYKDSSLPENISGRIEVVGRKRIIRVNPKEPWGHQRFVIAHELGHFLMHSGLSIEDGDDQNKYKDDYTKNPKSSLYFADVTKPARNSLKEKCADAFAAELLMPRDLFIQRYLFYSTNEKFNPSKNRIITIRCLSQAFLTKPSSIERRIQEIMPA